MPTNRVVRDWMDTWTNKSPPSFSATKSTEILDRIEYRLADTEEAKEELYELRYRAYLREGAVLPREPRRVTDRYDNAPNSWIFGIYLDGGLVSSIRISVVTQAHPESTVVEAFGDVLEPEIERGKILIAPAHFVADPEKTRLLPELPYVTIRLAFLACAHFEADLHLAIVRMEHAAFFRKVFHQQVMAEARLLPGFIKPAALLAANYQEVRETVFERFPYLRSSNFERRMLFERGSSKLVVAKRSLAEVKSHLEKVWSDDAVLPLCMKILDRVTISPINEAEMLDFTALCRMTGKNRPDAELLKAVTILTTSSFPTLRVCAKVRMEDGNDYAMEPQDLSSAIDFAIEKQTDPAARQKIDEFTDRIVVHFVPTSIFENPPAEISAAIS